MDSFINDLVAKVTFIMIGPAAKMCGINLVRDLVSDQYTIPQTNLPRDITYEESPALCAACGNITMEALESQEEYLHSKDLESFVRSANNCAFCNLILRQMCTAVRFHVQSDEEITNAREAAELLASFLAVKHQMFMLDPAPVILRLDHSRQLAGVDFVAIGTVLVEPLEEAHRVGLGFLFGGVDFSSMIPKRVWSLLSREAAMTKP